MNSRQLMVPIVLLIGILETVGHSDDTTSRLVDLKTDPVLPMDTSSIGEWTMINDNTTPVHFHVDWKIQLNSQLISLDQVDDTLGVDHALNGTSKVVVDGTDHGDAKLTDGNAYTGFETSWGDGYFEAVVTIDLGESRSVTAMEWEAGDANWIWNVDVSASLAGEKYENIEALQNIALHQKWSRQNFPDFQQVSARFLKFRFHNNGKSTNIIRLPMSIMVFDGSANDQVAIPEVGPIVQSGEFEAMLGSRANRSIPAELDHLLLPGAYLVSWETKINGVAQSHWKQIFVKPSPRPDSESVHRFGINGSLIQLVDSLAECGFGWVRFENGKWQMFSDARDHYAFDGSIAPWHVDQDHIYLTYNSKGLKVLPYVFQTPEWATRAGEDVKENRAGHPPKENADYGEAIFQMVARFGSKTHDVSSLKTTDGKSGLNCIQALELWNEPNLVGPSWAPFVGTVDEYFELMRVGIEAARRADPELPISNAGWAGVDLQTVAKMSEYKYADGVRPIDLVDIVNVHFYSGQDNPETSVFDPNQRDGQSDSTAMTFPQQVDALVKWRDENNADAEVWLTETGNDVGGPIGLSERDQAAKLPRVMMLSLAGGIDKVFIYRESGSDATMHAGAGLLRNDFTLRPSWFTVANVIRQLQGFDGKAERIPTADATTWLLVWKSETKMVIAGWTIDGDASHKISSYIPLADIETVIDAFGCPVKESLKQDLDVSLGAFPNYIHIRSGSETWQRFQ